MISFSDSLRTTGNHSTFWHLSAGAPGHWQAVTGSFPNGDSYIYETGYSLDEKFYMSDFTLYPGFTISNVRLNVVATAHDTGGQLLSFILQKGTHVKVTNAGPYTLTGWDTKYIDYGGDPWTLENWTVDDVNSLIVGVRTKNFTLPIFVDEINLVITQTSG